VLSCPFLQLRGVSFDALFHSPLDRAQHTAKLIWAGRSASVAVLPSLREVDLYAFQVWAQAVDCMALVDGGLHCMGNSDSGKAARARGDNTSEGDKACSSGQGALVTKCDIQRC
jgi:hypothetical protein